MSSAVHVRDQTGHRALKRRDPLQLATATPISASGHAATVARGAATATAEESGLPAATKSRRTESAHPLGTESVSVVADIDKDDVDIAPIVPTDDDGGVAGTSAGGPADSDDDSDEEDQELLRLELEALRRQRLRDTARTETAVASAKAHARYDADVLFSYDTAAIDGAAKVVGAPVLSASTVAAAKGTFGGAYTGRPEEITNDLTRTAFHHRFLKRFFQ